MKLTLLQHNIVRGSVIFVSLTAKFAFGRALPPIHFGRAPLTECALRYPPCQSGTFLVSPWQDDVSIRFLWYIDCQSDFDEPVSMASRPVDRGFCRRGSVSTSFHPVKRHFGRRKSISTTFRPPKGGFCRTAEPKMPFYPPKGGFCRMGNAMGRSANMRSCLFFLSQKNKNCKKPLSFLQFGAQSRARTGTFLRNTGF